MSMRFSLIFMIVLIGGCRKPVSVMNPHRFSDQDYDRIYTAAVEALWDFGFRIDRRDHRFGRISTLPLGAATVVEPWHPQNSSTGQAVQATFLDLRRRVNVMLDPETSNKAAPLHTGEGQDYLLRVEVLLEKRQLPTRGIINSGSGRLFTRLDAVPSEWKRRGITSSYWLSVGRDPQFEAKLVRQIVDRISP